MLSKISPILQHFLSIALVLNGTLLAINWFKNANPDKNEMILLIAIANLTLGLAVYFSGLRHRRAVSRQEEQN